MRKPVLEWDENGISYGLRYCGLKSEVNCHVQKSPSKLGQFTAWCNWEDIEEGKTYPTADAAKLACEDHLATLLEPLAATYEKLRGNR